jgi:RNA recognition motif-containing protein
LKIFNFVIFGKSPCLADPRRETSIYFIYYLRHVNYY